MQNHASKAAGPDYYSSPEWRALRAKALERAGGECMACGRKAPKGMHAHHIYGISVDPAGEHLAILCPICHDTVELLARRRSRLTPAVLTTLCTLAVLKINGPGGLDA